MALEARVREACTHDIVFAACGQVWVKYEWRIARPGTEEDVASHLYLEAREIVPLVEPVAEAAAKAESPSVPQSEDKAADAQGEQGDVTEEQPAETPPAAPDPAIDLALLTKEGLMAHAAERGIALKASMNKDAMIAAIQGA